MIGPANETVKFAPPAAPGNNATIDIWNSVTAFGPKMMRVLGMTELQVMFLRLDQSSAASGFVAQCSTDGGATWRGMDFSSTMPKQITLLAANTNDVETFDVTMVDDFRLQYTASGTGPSVWDLVISGIFGAAAVQK